jgi:serine/threonine-protein kinase
LGDAYRLDGELGGGGMSRVFVAHETALGRKVVVKVLLPELAAGVSVERFRREILLAAQLQHPHIVPLLSAGESQGLPYFIMPFVSGESLRARVMRSGELPIAEAMRILRDVVSALAYAHSHGVIHRDIKPDNVLLSGGVAVVTDFGVAKAVSASSGSSATALTSLGMALGTPAYMAPEQASGAASVDHRADIYALGVMAYEILTGRAPFLGRSTQATLAAHVLEMPDPVDRLRPVIPPTLASLVMSCLAKRPADRPQSALEIQNALDAMGTPSGGTAPTTVVSAAAIPADNSKKRGSLALPLGVVALAAAVGVLLWGRNQPRTAVPAPPGYAAGHPETLGAAPKPAQTPGVSTTAPPVVAESVPPAPTRRRVSPPAAPAREAAPPRLPATRAPRADSARVETPVVTQAAPAADRAAAVPPPAVPDTVTTTPAITPPPAADVTPPPATPAAPTPTAPVPTPPAPPQDARAEVRAVAEVIAEYGRAIESESVGNMRRVYPGMREEQQRGWEQFFSTVRGVRTQLTVRQADVSGDVGSALVGGVYTYENGSTHRTEEQQVSFRAVLRRSGAGWRITEIR